jgi:tetratricopeptide (TPR) repeat protein
MKIDSSILYAACPCGSGKKFKFCCFEKVRNDLYDGIGPDGVAAKVKDRFAPFTDDPGVDPVADRAAIDAACRGKRALMSGEFADSAWHFREARTACPNMISAWDSEVTGLWGIGEYEMALETARASLASPNGGSVFGLAQMAEIEYFLGDDAAYEKHVEEAVGKGRPTSVHAAVKVCQALALSRRHKDIFDYALRYGAKNSTDLSFYAATAAANLGKRQEAQHFIDALSDDGRENVLVESLALALDDTEDGVPESTCPFGDWQYFTLEDYPAQDLVGKAIAERLPEHRNVICDVAEILLGEHSIDKAAALEALAAYYGGRVSELRRFLAETEEFDDIFADEYERFPTSGNEIAMQRTLLDFGFGPVVLNGWAPNEGSVQDITEAEAFDKAVRELASADLNPGTPRWDEIREFLHSLYEKYPDRPACGTNYANMLREEGKYDEAYAVLNQMRKVNPLSVYVTATALRFATCDDDEQKAAKIIRSFRLPGRLHPTTYEYWLNAKKDYYEYVRDDVSVENIERELDCVKQYSRNQKSIVF